MANYYPLIVNQASRKIEELRNTDSLDLTNNNIIADSSTGAAGQYLKSDGAKVVWGTAGDVYLTASQTISNKTFSNCSISAVDNVLIDIPNSSLQNSSITVNGAAISLGGTVTTPNDNTTYDIAALDGVDATEKIVQLTDSDGTTDDITFKVGLNMSIARLGDVITLSSSFVDTITRIQGGTSGTPVTGDVTIQTSGTSTVSQTGNVITIDADKNIDTITRLKGESAGTFESGDVTLVQSGATTISQTGKNITVSSQDTITRVKGGASGTLLSGDITIVGATDTSVSQVGDIITVDTTNTVTTVEGEVNATAETGAVRILGGTNVTSTQSGKDITVSSIDTITRLRGTASGSFTSGDFTLVGADDIEVSQSGNTITFTSSDQDTITRVRGTTGGTYESGDITIVGTNDATVSQSGSTITIDVQDQDTTYTAGNGLVVSNEVFSLKNNLALTTNKVLKYDATNTQLVNTIITDDGSTVTIGGNLTVTGTTTTVNSTVVAVADADIELRAGVDVVAGDGGIQINRTTDSSGAVTDYRAFQWFESGGYWRSWDGTTTNRIVSENESQTLTNKTLTSPTLTTPDLGIATATTINKVTITEPASGSTLTLSDGKTLIVNSSVTLAGNDNVTVSYGAGGNVVYTSNKLSALSSTSSDELRGIITDETGTGSLVFAIDPVFTDSVTTTTTIFDVFNTNATTINAFGAATTVNLGASTGTIEIGGSLNVNGNVTINDNAADSLTVNGIVDFVNVDITVRGITAGRGASGTATTTAFGKDALRIVSGSAGANNTALGYETLYNNTSGAKNTSVGFRAGHTYSSGSDNVSVGDNAARSATIGDKNVAVGNAALYGNIQGDNNLCLGHYAGYNLTGSGNVLIGPAWNEVNTDATYEPPNATGDNQLVIGSGGGTWINGDSSFNLSLPNNLIVNGLLYTEGEYTYLNSKILEINSTDVSIADTKLVIGDVQSTNFTATVTQGSTSFSITDYGNGIVPGMIVISQTDGITVPINTTIVSIDYVNSTGVLSAAPNLGTGNVTFSAAGPSNTTANGGGILLKGATDKSFTWNLANNAWTSSHSIDLLDGLAYKIDGTDILSETTLATSVVNSSLTSVGTLSSLTVSGNGTFSGTGYLQIPAGNDGSDKPTGADGMIRYNTTVNTFEGYSGVWGKIGGGATISSDAPTNATTGDLWFDEDDGRLFIYYTYDDANGDEVNQWIDASPYGTTTDLVVEGTTELQGTATTRAILPDADDTYDLGSASKRWANIYSADLQLSNEGAANDVDGTWGQYTIQEGEDDLFLINRRSGKKYKFMLQEVN